MKRIIIWVLIIFIILILAGFVFSYPGMMLVSSWFFSSDCGDNFNKAFDEAVKNNNTNFCLNYGGDIKYGKDIGFGIGCSLSETKYGIRENSFQDSCLEAMSYSTKNIEFCKLIKDENSKGSCVLSVARSEGNISYCEILNKTNAYYGPCIGNNNYKP